MLYWKSSMFVVYVYNLNYVYTGFKGGMKRLKKKQQLYHQKLFILQIKVLIYLFLSIWLHWGKIYIYIYILVHDSWSDIQFGWSLMYWLI